MNIVKYMFLCMFAVGCAGQVESNDGPVINEVDMCVQQGAPHTVCGCESVIYSLCENGQWYMETDAMRFYCDADPNVTSNCYTPKLSMKQHCGC